MNNGFSEFNWGQTNQEYINLFSTENFVNRIYEKHYKIKKDDVIVDAGSNYGAFSLSIQDSQPKHIYCIEPSSAIFDVLKENLNHMPCTFINKAIGCDDDEKKLIGNENFIYHQNEPHFSTIKFKTFLETYNIKKIDFLKFDCEGGEFHIFNEENLDFIKNNVRNIAGEYHITYHSNSVEKFINFRNNYLKDLKEFGKLYIYDRDDNNITEKIFDDDYVRSFEQNSWNTNPYKGQFMIYANFEKNNLNQKLINFPPVYYISLSDSTDRQQLFEEQFSSNGIKNVKMIEAYDGRKVNYCIDKSIVDGFHLETMDSGGIAATISHLKAISDWYNSSDSEYAIFFEDDISIESINDWNFTWDEFVNILPQDWKAIQLSLIKDKIENNDMRLNQRVWWNWSAGCYLIRRNYAKELIDYFYQDDKYYLRIRGDDNSIPCIEHCLFLLGSGNVYTFPLFYENINFVSTFYEHFIESTHKNFQIDSSNYVKYWWKITGSDKTLNDFKLKKNNNLINHIYQNSEFGEDSFSYPNLYKSMNEISDKEKLKNFPPVNFVSIEESQDRRNILYEMFEEYGIKSVTPHIYKRYRDEDHKIIEGPIINHTGKGVVISHLKAIKEWYENTDEPYALFCEDDLCFDSVKYWNFTWQDFFNSLPNNWNLIQLCLIREEMFLFFNPDVKIRNRCWCDWSTCAYLISRNHAKKLIDNYYPDNYIHLEYKGFDKHIREKEYYSHWFLFPHAENLIYSCFDYIQPGIYAFPLFVENTSFSSTWSGRNDNWLNVHSYNEIINWWKTKGYKKSLDDLKL